MEALLAAVGLLVIVTLITIPALMYQGWVFAKLWGWLIMPIFPGLPALSFIFAMGLVFFVRYIVGAKNDTPDKTTKWYVTILTIQLVAPTLALGMGWLIHYFY